MNPFDRSVETGKMLIRAKGINFTKFKAELNLAVRFREKRDEDSYVDWYNLYAYANSIIPEDVATWAKDFFQEHEGVKIR